MIKKIQYLLSVILLIPIFIPAVPVQAAGELKVIENSASIYFPSMINFDITAESNTDITDIRLHYYVDRLSYASVTSEIYIKFTPDTRITTEWSWDMRKTGGLPPGTKIMYWWSLKDASGAEIKTTPVTLQFNDDRFKWQTIKKDKVTLSWYEGDRTFAEKLLAAAMEGLERLSESTGVQLEDSVDIYIYADSSDLQNAMIFPQTWTGGVAYSLYGTIAIGIETANLEWGLKTVVHELTHLVISQMTYNPYLNLPTWLDEGLAMYMEGQMDDIFDYYLSKAVEDDKLISVRSLASPFSAYADQSYLSYAESYGLVLLLINKYGQEKMLELLTILGNGSNYDEALTEVYGFDMDGLDVIWKDFIERAYDVQTDEVKLTGTEPVLSLSSPVLTTGNIPW